MPPPQCLTSASSCSSEASCVRVCLSRAASSCSTRGTRTSSSKSGAPGRNFAPPRRARAAPRVLPPLRAGCAIIQAGGLRTSSRDEPRRRARAGPSRVCPSEHRSAAVLLRYVLVWRARSGPHGFARRAAGSCAARPIDSANPAQRRGAFAGASGRDTVVSRARHAAWNMWIRLRARRPFVAGRFDGAPPGRSPAGRRCLADLLGAARNAEGCRRSGGPARSPRGASAGAVAPTSTGATAHVAGAGARTATTATSGSSTGAHAPPRAIHADPLAARRGAFARDARGRGALDRDAGHRQHGRVWRGCM